MRVLPAHTPAKMFKPNTNGNFSLYLYRIRLILHLQWPDAPQGTDPKHPSMPLQEYFPNQLIGYQEALPGKADAPLVTCKQSRFFKTPGVSVVGGGVIATEPFPVAGAFESLAQPQAQHGVFLAVPARPVVGPFGSPEEGLQRAGRVKPPSLQKGMGRRARSPGIPRRSSI